MFNSQPNGFVGVVEQHVWWCIWLIPQIGLSCKWLQMKDLQNEPIGDPYRCLHKLENLPPGFTQTYGGITGYSERPILQDTHRIHARRVSRLSAGRVLQPWSSLFPQHVSCHCPPDPPHLMSAPSAWGHAAGNRISPLCDGRHCNVWPCMYMRQASRDMYFHEAEGHKTKNS